MRAMRPSLAVASSLVLCFGLATTATAQEEPAPVTSVTGTVAEVYGYDVYEEDASSLDTYDIRGYEVMTQTGAPIREVVEWSDPRLPADLWLSLGYTLIWQGEDQWESDGAMSTAWQILLEDDEGRWRGTGRSVQAADEKYSLYELTGDGAYEGLSALLRGTPPDDMEAGLLHASRAVGHGVRGLHLRNRADDVPRSACPAHDRGLPAVADPDRVGASHRLGCPNRRSCLAGDVRPASGTIATSPSWRPCLASAAPRSAPRYGIDAGPVACSSPCDGRATPAG